MADNRFKALLFALFVVFYVRVLRPWYKKAQRRRELLNKLPGKRLNEAAGKRSWIYGSMRCAAIPEGLQITTKNMEKYFMKNIAESMYTQLEPEDGLVCLWLLSPKIPLHPGAVIIPRDIEVVRQILSTKLLSSQRKGRAYNVSKPLIGNSILRSSGPHWAKQRAVLDMGFVPSILASQFPSILKSADELVAKVRTLQGDIPVVELMLKTTLDVLGRVAFSYDIGGLTAGAEGSPLYEAFECILQTLANRTKQPIRIILPLPEFLDPEFAAAMHTLESKVQDILSSRLAAGDVSGEPKDLLDVMLKSDMLKEKDAKTLIVDNIKTILFAGHDTTANALTWFTHLLSLHPEVADKIRQELDRFGGKITVETVEELDYLNNCILEVLRLYPSAGFTRQTTEEMQVGKYTIPAGTDIAFFPYITHRDPRYFENADKFIPERWNKERTEKLNFQSRLAHETLKSPFYPFSLGKRNCVGRPLALLEIRVVILRLLQEFDILPPAVVPEEFQDYPQLGLTMVPVGIRTRFVPRK